MADRVVSLLLCVGVLGAVNPLRADVFDIYIAAGQSNMDGRGLKSDLVGPLAPYAAVQNNVLLHFTNPRDPVDDSASRPTFSSGGWVPLEPGYAAQPGISGAATFPSTNFGPEVSFGRTLADNTTGRKVAIIKVSRGGESLSSAWDPSDGFKGDKGYIYKAFETVVPQAIQALQAAGHSVEIRGMIWHHGSADVASSYESNLREFIQVVRDDLGYSNLPFIIGELAGDAGNRPALRAIQANVAATTGFSGFIPSEGLELKSDGIHFTTAGVIELGDRFAEKMLTSIFTIPGDFNRDGIVDMQDFAVWDTFKGTLDARADGDNDGDVDRDDYQIWLTAVPEPSTASLASAHFLAGTWWIRRTRSLHRRNTQWITLSSVQNWERRDEQPNK
jgi:iduronate 2-sulfatase